MFLYLFCRFLIKRVNNTVYCIKMTRKCKNHTHLQGKQTKIKIKQTKITTTIIKTKKYKQILAYNSHGRQQQKEIAATIIKSGLDTV